MKSVCKHRSVEVLQNTSNQIGNSLDLMVLAHLPFVYSTEHNLVRLALVTKCEETTEKPAAASN